MAMSQSKHGGASICPARNPSSSSSSSFHRLKRTLVACPQPHLFFIFLASTVFLLLTALSYNNTTSSTPPLWFSAIFRFTPSPSGNNVSPFSSFYNYYYCSLPSSSSLSLPPAPSQNKDAPFLLPPQPTDSSTLLSPMPAQVSPGNALGNHSNDTLVQKPSFDEFRNESAANYTARNPLSLDKQETIIIEVTNASNPASSVHLLKNVSSWNVDRPDDPMKLLMDCDMFDGEWVMDESYPLYKPGSCNLIDEQFNCFLNGRPDNGYYKLKWKPKACTLPRLNGSHMLELLRGKRLVFVGDSLNRNMWESLVCILRNSVKDKTKIYERSGRKHFRSEASFFFVFQEYNCTVEFFVSPFLVQEWDAKDRDGRSRETLRLDIISRYGDKYKNADIIVFNTGHWWTHDKTSTGKNYFQEGNHVYPELNVLEAFRRAVTTWGRWIDANVDPTRSLVLFRGYSASHFSGGQWNSGGQCDGETEPIKDDKYLNKYPPMLRVLEEVLERMKTRVRYLNVTRMTDYRKDGHPSIYRRKQYAVMSEEEKKAELNIQDCSHWCLPGVPDAWNEILYAHLLIRVGLRTTRNNNTGIEHGVVPST